MGAISLAFPKSEAFVLAGCFGFGDDTTRSFGSDFGFFRPKMRIASERVFSPIREARGFAAGFDGSRSGLGCTLISSGFLPGRSGNGGGGNLRANASRTATRSGPSVS